MIIVTSNPKKDCQASIVEFHESQAKYRLMEGGYQSGKTTAAIWEIFNELSRLARPTTVLIGRWDYTELEDTTMAKFYEILPPELITDRRDSAPPQCYLYGQQGIRHKILFRHCQNKKGFESLTLGLAFLDQIEEILEAVVETIIARLSHPAGPRKLIAAANPAEPEHWLYQWFHDPHTLPNSEWFFVDTRKNKFLPPDYLRELESRPPLWKKRYLDGKWGYLTTTGAYFADECREEHFAPVSPSQAFRQLRGWDFGRHAMIRCQSVPLPQPQGPPLYQLQIWGEMLNDTGGIHARALSAFVEKERELFPPMMVKQGEEDVPLKIEDYCDAAGASPGVSGKDDKKPVEILNALNIYPQYSFANVDWGLGLIHELLLPFPDGSPRLVIDPDKCPLLSRAFQGGYRRKPHPQTQGAFLDVPLKDGFFEHVMDCLRYIVQNIVRIGIPKQPTKRKLRSLMRRIPGNGFTTYSGWRRESFA